MSEAVKWGLYNDMLTNSTRAKAQNEIDEAQQSAVSLITGSPCYQPNATRNGIKQGLGAMRKTPKECLLFILPEDDLYIGDTIQCLGEKWLVYEKKLDEYGLITGKAVICNHVLKFQNSGSEIYSIDCFVDNGSFSFKKDKKIVSVTGEYSIYIPYNDNTKFLSVGKRLSIAKIYDSQGELTLDTYKVVWVDTMFNKFGTGSYLAKIDIEKCDFNQEKDDVDSGVCDYVRTTENAIDDDVGGGEHEPENLYYIDGQTKIRVGTSRKYIGKLLDTNGNDINDFEGTWSVSNTDDGVVFCVDANILTITIPLLPNLIGEKITISLSSVSGDYADATKEVEVIDIG